MYSISALFWSSLRDAFLSTHRGLSTAEIQRTQPVLQGWLLHSTFFLVSSFLCSSSPGFYAWNNTIQGNPFLLINSLLGPDCQSPSVLKGTQVHRNQRSGSFPGQKQYLNNSLFSRKNIFKTSPQQKTPHWCIQSLITKQHQAIFHADSHRGALVGLWVHEICTTARPYFWALNKKLLPL